MQRVNGLTAFLYGCRTLRMPKLSNPEASAIVRSQVDIMLDTFFMVDSGCAINTEVASILLSVFHVVLYSHTQLQFTM